MKKSLIITITMVLVIFLSGAVMSQTVLEFWIIEPFTTNPDDAIYEAVKIFEEQNPEIKVNVNPIPAVDIKDTYVTQVYGGGGPDLATLDIAWQAQLAQLDLLADITSQYENIRDQFLEGPATTGEVGDKAYSVPWYTNNVAFFYNMDLLNEVGYDEPPKDWNEFQDMCIKVTEETDAYGVTMGDGQFMSFTYLPFLYSAGGKVVDEDGPRFHKDGGKVAFKYVTDLYVKHRVMSEGAINASSWSELYAPFHQGNAAVTITGDWGIGPLQDANVDFEWVIASPPAYPETGKRATVIGGYNLAISPNTENFEEAWKFIEFLSSEENMWILEDYSRISALKASMDSEYAKENELQQVFFEQGSIGVARAGVPEYEEVSDLLADVFEEVLFEEMTAEEALEYYGEVAKKEIFDK